MTEKNPKNNQNKNQNKNWQRMSFKGNKVWAQTDDSGNLQTINGKVTVKYNLKQDYQYNVKTENLLPEDQAVAAADKSTTKKSDNTGSKKPGFKKTGTKKAAKTTKKQSKTQEAEKDPAVNLPDNCIRIYTDGASSSNPGPSGIGVLFIYGEKKKEISSYIGKTTNNVAELTAVKVALEKLKRFDLPVRIFSDSTYVIGVLTKNWNAKANQQLIIEIKNLIKKFQDIAFIKIKGHAGIKENEVADFLATSGRNKGSL